MAATKEDSQKLNPEEKLASLNANITANRKNLNTIWSDKHSKGVPNSEIFQAKWNGYSAPVRSIIFTIINYL